MVIEPTTKSIVYVVFRQRRIIVASVLAGLILTVAYCLWATALYRADASVVVNFNRQLTGSLGTDQTAASGPATPTDADEILNSYTLVFQSNALAEQVINTIGLAKMYPKYVEDGVLAKALAAITRALGIYKTPLQRAVYRFVNRDTDVEVGKDSTVIQLTLYNADPVIAKRALDLLVDDFLLQQARIGRDPQVGFAQSQVAVYRKQVADAQSAMEAFQLKHKISSMDEENSYLLKQRSDLEGQSATNKVQMEEDQRKIAALTAQLKTLTETVDLHQEDRDLALDAARTQLVQLQVRQQTLNTGFGADSPAARINDAEIAKVEAFINSYPNRTPLRQMAPNPTYQVTQSSLLQAQADLQATTKAQTVLAQQVEDLSARLGERSQEQSAYQDLVREYQIDDQNYRTYLQSVQQARIADDLNKQKASTVAIYDPAYLVSEMPVKPKKTLWIVGGMLLGLILGLSAAFVREAWDERLNTPQQVNALLGLPLLGSMANFQKAIAAPALPP
jgi:succinoglycan biosynthesis transport protein ExoP